MSELGGLLPADSWTRFAFDAAWQSTLVGLAAWLALRLLVRRAAARAWIALAAIGLSLAIPVLSAGVRWADCGLLAGPVAVNSQPKKCRLSWSSSHFSSLADSTSPCQFSLFPSSSFNLRTISLSMRACRPARMVCVQFHQSSVVTIPVITGSKMM
jgi:hypothetical protein